MYALRRLAHVIIKYFYLQYICGVSLEWNPADSVFEVYDTSLHMRFPHWGRFLSAYFGWLANQRKPSTNVLQYVASSQVYSGVSVGMVNSPWSLSDDFSWVTVSIDVEAAPVVDVDVASALDDVVADAASGKLTVVVTGTLLLSTWIKGNYKERSEVEKQFS